MYPFWFRFFARRWPRAVWIRRLAFAFAAQDNPNHHPAPWWYILLSFLFPSRCREVPRPRDRSTLLLRQFAIWSRYVYLQQVCSDEDPDWYHNHQWDYMIAIGLWGGYREYRLAGGYYDRRAPYCYMVNGSVIHNVQSPTKGHTALYIGLFRNDAQKHYYAAPEILDRYDLRRHWEDHITERVARI